MKSKKLKKKIIQVYEDTYWDKIINQSEANFKKSLKEMDKIWKNGSSARAALFRPLTQQNRGMYDR